MRCSEWAGTQNKEENHAGSDIIFVSLIFLFALCTISKKHYHWYAAIELVDGSSKYIELSGKCLTCSRNCRHHKLCFVSFKRTYTYAYVSNACAIFFFGVCAMIFSWNVKSFLTSSNRVQNIILSLKIQYILWRLCYRQWCVSRLKDMK